MLKKLKYILNICFVFLFSVNAIAAINLTGKISINGICNLKDNPISTYGFTTEWTVSGDATARTITLPLTNNGTYNATVSWGDGTANSTITAYNDADRVHTYTSDGIYRVEIIGDCPGWSFNNGGDKLKITNIIYWGNSAKFSGFLYLTNGFYGCSNLKSAGTDSILPYDTSLVNFTSLFDGCSKLSSVPEDLFKYVISATTFYATFYGCSLLVNIPANLFRYNTSAITFALCFGSCLGIVSIPAELFKYNIAVTTFGSTFYGCSNLATLSAELFKYNIAVTTFLSTFNSCPKLQLRLDIFYAAGESGTRFLNQSPNFSNCFTRSTFTGVQGTAPDLWACNFGTGTPTTTSCYSGAGNSLTSITNYGDIPAGYK